MKNECLALSTSAAHFRDCFCQWLWLLHCSAWLMTRAWLLKGSPQIILKASFIHSSFVHHSSIKHSSSIHSSTTEHFDTTGDFGQLHESWRWCWGRSCWHSGEVKELRSARHEMKRRVCQSVPLCFVSKCSVVLKECSMKATNYRQRGPNKEKGNLKGT